MCTRPTRLFSRTEVPPASTPAFCQPYRGALVGGSTSSFLWGKARWAPDHPGGFSDPEGPEQGPAPSWSEVSVNLQWLVSIAAGVGSKGTEPA